MTALSFDEVTIAYGRSTVLDGVSFEIAKGAFVGVLGANGSGKTTTMRSLVGLVRAKSGRIAVLGARPRRGNPRIGYMPQHRTDQLADRLSVRAYMLAAAAGRRWGRPWPSRLDRHAADAALESIDASRFADRPLADLSGGERQRVLIAQALIGDPELLVLDEPLAGLDPSRQRAVVGLVRRLADERAMTVLFSAHDVNSLLGAADLILHLGNGKAALGTVDAVIRGDVLSTLYGTPVEVHHVGGRIFVTAGVDGEPGGTEAPVPRARSGAATR